MSSLIINIKVTCNSNGSRPYQFGNREDYLNLGVPLYHAASTCDWETANIIFGKHPNLVRFSLSQDLGTALHVAVNAKWTMKKVNFVKNLVNMMTADELELTNKHSNTAFWEAAAFGRGDEYLLKNKYFKEGAAFGRLEVIKIMMQKNHNLLNIRGSNGLLPLSAGALMGTTRTVRHLYTNSQKMSGDQWTDRDRDLTLLHCLQNSCFVVAGQILEDRPELARNVSLLEVLAIKHPIYFKTSILFNLFDIILLTANRLCGTNIPPSRYGGALKLLKTIWEYAIRTMDIEEIENMLRGPSRILFIAAEGGNTVFVVELLRTYPHLMLDTNEDGLTIFHIAVMRRHVGIYNLLYEVGDNYMNSILAITDKSGNNILHLIAKTSKEMAATGARASLLMQREALWFLEVQGMMPRYLRSQKNKDGETPLELFLKETEDLVSKELKWMKDCMVVATLIVTVAFAAAFTIPGGYNQEHGLPIFTHQPMFLLFVIADAISLFSSSTSLLVFLSILTSRHRHHDFIASLPNKIVLGLLTLFISVAAMMVTFTASFFVLYDKGLKWVPFLVASFATIPVIVSALLQFPLLVDMFRSKYDPHYLFCPNKRMLYNTRT